MADAPKKSGGGKGISKKLGPLPYWGWALAGGGGYLAYRYLRARSAASSASAATGTTGGDLIPNDIGLPTSVGSTVASFTSTAAWEQAMLSFLTGNGISNGDALNAATSYLNGNCVSQALYNALAAGLVSPNVGLPPGFTAPPTLSVCPATQQTPTPSGGSPTPSNPNPAPAPGVNGPPIFQGLDAALGNALAANGESIVSTQWDSTLNEFILLTNKGGIYNVNAQGQPSGGTFYGSYLGLPAADREGVRSFTQLIINPDGTYTAVSNGGQTYTFNPSTAQLEGV